MQIFVTLLTGDKFTIDCTDTIETIKKSYLLLAELLIRYYFMKEKNKIRLQKI